MHLIPTKNNESDFQSSDDPVSRNSTLYENCRILQNSAECGTDFSTLTQFSEPTSSMLCSDAQNAPTLSNIIHSNGRYRIRNATNNIMNGGAPQLKNSRLRISSGVENYPRFTVSSFQQLHTVILRRFLQDLKVRDLITPTKYFLHQV